MPQSNRPRALDDAARNDDDGVTFVPVSVGRASNLIVDQIRALIRNGRLSAGDRLPSERELGEQFCVSRVTVREALRGLEANGLVAIRVGARGGAFVTAPTIQQVSEGIADLLTFSVVSPDEVAEARRAFELSIIPLVCERADEQDIVDLVGLCDSAGPTPGAGRDRGVSTCSGFHLRMARAAHNSAIEMLACSLDEQSSMSPRRPREDAGDAARAIAREHRNLVLAVQSRDCESARAIVSTHLTETRATGEPVVRNDGPVDPDPGRDRASDRRTAVTSLLATRSRPMTWG